MTDFRGTAAHRRMTVDNDTAINSRKRAAKTVIIMAMIALVCFIAARLSLFLASGHAYITYVWPPSGIALAAILLYGYRMGPAVFIGTLFGNLLALKGAGLEPSYYLAISSTTAIGTMLEGFIGAYLIRRFALKESPFDDIRDLFVFIIFGALAATLISPTIGAAGYCLATGDWQSYARLWLTWWLGDAAGVLIVSPIILLLNRGGMEKVSGTRLIEAAGALIVLTASCLTVFSNNAHLEYAIIPPLLWIAFRFGRLYSAGAILLVAGIAVAFTVAGAGPSRHAPEGQSLLYLQTYIGLISVVTLCVSVLAYEREESDRSRLATQKLLYDIIEFLPDATFAIDRNGTVIAWNRAMEQLAGISKNEMMGKGDYEYAVPFFGERRPILIDLVMKITDRSALQTYDYIEKKGNTLFAERYNPLLGRHLAGAASLLIDSGGTVYGAIESIRDISDRMKAELELRHYKDHLEEIIKERSAELLHANEQLLRQIEYQERAERALLESEKKYRDLVESANSVIMRWKPDGSITYFNPCAQKFFGFTEQEILGRSVVGTIVPERESSGRDLAALMENIVRNPEAYAFNENENIRKNGERVWIAWTNRPIFDDSGSFMEILSVGNDITERKNMEESLKKTMGELARAKERAEAADRIKSAFLATMSHELRTPLNSIIGFTGILLQDFAGPLNDEQRKQMGMVRASAQHLLSLINDVLDISKIEAGQFEVHAEPFDLRAVIEKAVAAMRPAAEKKGLALTADIGEDVRGIVGDQRRVEQVLLNLLSNAVKFTERGSVTLTASVMHAFRPPGAGPESGPVPAVACRVADTGIGIRTEDLRELFKPFRQIDTGLARRNEGTGLGLAICRRLADLLGGEVVAESAPGKGSTFMFTIPLQGTRHEEDRPAD